MIRIVALACGIAALIMVAVPFTAITLPVESVFPARPDSVANVDSMVTITQSPTPLNVGQAQHSAFPGMARVFDGSLRLLWRQGSSHESSDGRIQSATSFDDGASWVNVQTLRVNPDYRDPFISEVDGIEYLTWFGARPGAPALGAGVMRYMNAESRRIDPAANSYGAISAPVVKLPNGQLGTAFYGRQPGESIDTSFLAWSSDSGWTWTSNRIVNGIGGGVAYNEPYPVVDGSMLRFFYRDGSDGIGLRSSSDSGVSGSWDAPHRILSDATGRPTTVLTGNGVLVMVYRQASSKAARIAFSTDHSATWQDGGVLAASKGGIGMTYASMVADGPDVIGVLGLEDSGGAASKLYGFRLSTS